MKNQKWEIGGWRMANPETVIKLGFVLDSYKKPQLEQLWKVAEGEAKERMPLFEAGDFFFQEEIPKGDLLYSFRYYTPANNRVKIGETDKKEGML